MEVALGTARVHHVAYSRRGAASHSNAAEDLDVLDAVVGEGDVGEGAEGDDAELHGVLFDLLGNEDRRVVLLH
jgi:hypothetical protein